MLPQIILVVLQLLSLGIMIGKHGEEKTGKENAWYSIVSAIIIFTLLLTGGFFDVFIK